MIFRGGRGRNIDLRGKHPPTASCTPSIRGRTHNPDWKSNGQSLDAWNGTQTTEPHPTGWCLFFIASSLVLKWSCLPCYLLLVWQFWCLDFTEIWVMGVCVFLNCYQLASSQKISFSRIPQMPQPPCHCWLWDMRTRLCQGRSGSTLSQIFIIWRRLAQ